MIVKSLYKDAEGDLDEFYLANLLKQAVSTASALSIPNPNKIIHLYLHSDKGQVLVLMAQSVGDSVFPIDYLSKQLDPIYRGWSAYLKVLATAALLIPESPKVTFNLPMTLWSSHNIQD
jgi:hypothetical protein